MAAAPSARDSRDLLSHLNVPGEEGAKGKTLQNLRVRLGELLGEDAWRAQGAADVPRSVVALRAGQQHSGTSATKGAGKARNTLGLSQFGDDWAAAWDHVRAVTAQALTTIREEISSHIK